MWTGTIRRIEGPLFVAFLLTTTATPARAIDFAEVELTGSSVSRSGAPANFGFPIDSPDLVSSDDTETPLGIHDDHEDTAFVRDRLYRSDERVNASHRFGGSGTARGSIEEGHSISVTTGYADAGSNEMGGWAEASAGPLGSGDASGVSSMKIEKKITISPGASGLAAMELSDSFGQTTLLRFNSIERNPKLDPQLFRFSPPAGADVIGDTR